MLIDSNSEETSHPLIFKAQEYQIPAHELWLKISKLEKNLQKKDLNTSLNILKELVRNGNQSYINNSWNKNTLV